MWLLVASFPGSCTGQRNMSLVHTSLYALGIWIHADTIAYYTDILSMIVLPLVALECWKTQSCNNGSMLQGFTIFVPLAYTCHRKPPLGQGVKLHRQACKSGWGGQMCAAFLTWRSLKDTVTYWEATTILSTDLTWYIMSPLRIVTLRSLQTTTTPSLQFLESELWHTCQDNHKSMFPFLWE